MSPAIILLSPALPSSPVPLLALASGPSGGLAVYLALIAAASFAGGTTASLMTLGHRRMQILLSMTAGVMLGVSLLHLLPHAYLESGGDIDGTARWVLAGFFLMFLLERAFHGHAHHSAEGEPCGHDHAHGDDHVHVAGHREAAAGRWAWCGAFAGLALHSLVDGAALAASVHADGGQGAGFLSGFATFFAIVLHKPFDSLMIATLMIAAGTTARLRRATTFFYALIVPIGAIAFHWSLGLLGDRADGVLAAAMAMAAGAFLCIAAADLLPEVEFHSHDRVFLTASLVVGIGIAWGMTVLEHASHAHAFHARGRAAENDRAVDHGHDHGH
jgi:zinc and cadmium transporter